MIVPAGVLGLHGASSLREVLLGKFGESYCSTYAIRPSKLFNEVDQRLCIYLGTIAEQSTPTIWTTKYQRWNAEERESLFPQLEYAQSALHERLNRVPQAGNANAVSIMQKLEVLNSKTVSAYFSPSGSGHLMHYHRSPRYWIRAMDFEQYFKSPTRSRSVYHFRDLYFRDSRVAKTVGAILNSSLFFWWFVSVGNGRNITGTDIEQFPVGDLTVILVDSAPAVFAQLMIDYKINSFIRKRKDCEFQEFRPGKSKPIMDEIDRVLAKHYDFNEEELDFIINYDIKYRMGDQLLEEEGEEE